MMKLYVRAFLIALVCFVSVGCKPRGETKSLDTLLGDSRQKFAVATSQAPALKLNFAGSELAETSVELPEVLRELNSNLDKLLVKGSAADRSGTASTVAKTLAALTPHAGYTARPAFAEISKQYRTISQGASIELATLKLVAARTYALISSELETTKFGL